MKKILCIGGVTTDIILSPVDSLPPPGVLRAVQSASTHVGGCAANAAIDLGKLGVPVALSCQVGQDTLGDFVIEQAGGAGVDTQWIVRGGEPTTCSIVCVNSQGERCFLYYPGSTSAYSIESLPASPPRDCDIVFVAEALLLDSFDGQPAGEYLARARAQGAYTVMDTAWDPDGVWMPKIQAALPGLDLFMPSLEEAQKLSGKEDPKEIADVFFGIGVKSVIVKLGSQGAYLCPTPEERYTLPAYPGIAVADTTGAGDSFCAGFLCGLANGWDFRACGQFANAVGALCVTKIGASTGVPSMKEVLEFMESHTFLE